MEPEAHAIKLLESFFQTYTVQIFQPGETILSPANTSPPIFYLDQGVISVYMLQRNGERFLINWMPRTTTFPLYWALVDSTSSYYYEAKTLTTIYKSPKKEFVTFLSTHPECLLFVTRKVLVGTYFLSQRIELLIASSISDKLQFLLLNLSRTFGKKQKNGDVIIELEVGHNELASWIHSTRESVTREITKLKKLQIMDMSGKNITIYNTQYLEEKFT